MGETTKIEWADATWNPWQGCREISQGCTNCYARELLARWGKDAWGNSPRILTADWKKPETWNRKAEKSGEPWRVFPSLCDPFEQFEGAVVESKGAVLHWNGKNPVLWIGPDCPYRRLTLDDLRRDLFALIDRTPHLTWLLLTKRPENIRRMWPFDDCEPTPIFPGMPGPLGQPQPCKQKRHRENVWLVTSVEDQATFDIRVPALLKCHDLSPVLGLSYEPALGPVNLSMDHCNALFPGDPSMCDANSLGTDEQRCGCLLSWVIIGGESGAHARPFDLAWARSAVRQCREAGVKAFCKQFGDNVLGYARGVFGAKGGDIDRWPDDLKVREFPEVQSVRT